MSTSWGLLAAILFLAAWLISILVESLTAIIVALLGGLFSVIMAVIAQRSPRVQREWARPAQSARNAPRRASARAQPVNPSADRPRKRPPCSARCRNSVRPKRECKCVCGGDSHGSARAGVP